MAGDAREGNAVALDAADAGEFQRAHRQRRAVARVGEQVIVVAPPIGGERLARVSLRPLAPAEAEDFRVVGGIGRQEENGPAGGGEVA